MKSACCPGKARDTRREQAINGEAEFSAQVQLTAIAPETGGKVCSPFSFC
jgi:hypothetical protein